MSLVLLFSHHQSSGGRMNSPRAREICYGCQKTQKKKKNKKKLFSRQTTTKGFKKLRFTLARASQLQVTVHGEFPSFLLCLHSTNKIKICDSIWMWNEVVNEIMNVVKKAKLWRKFVAHHLVARTNFFSLPQPTDISSRKQRRKGEENIKIRFEFL